MKLGLLREGKTPPDKRVALTPQQCALLQERYPDLEIYVQRSAIRAFSDQEYAERGLTLVDSLENCEVLLGVKEVPIEELIPNKTYLFFSHTYKKQPYNRDLLRAILSKKIRLIDHELLKAPAGKRLLGFGRYAGIVGAYNAFRAWGQMSGDFELKPAHTCLDRKELEFELTKMHFPKPIRIALTGTGKVAAGVMEMFSAARITQVFPEEYLSREYSENVYTQLEAHHYFKHHSGRAFSRYEAYANPEEYSSNFDTFAAQSDLYIPAHYWSDRSPYIFTQEQAASPHSRIRLVADISCDIAGPICSTIRPSTIADPFYGYDPRSGAEVPFGAANSIGVCAVDNLPCELPRDASEDFGNELVKNVMPHFFNGDADGILERASQTNMDGALMPNFDYLRDFVAP